MKCARCGSETKTAMLYCDVCGTRLDLGIERVKVELYRRAQEEARQQVRSYVHNVLVFCIVLLFIALTIYWAVGEIPRHTSIPGLTPGTNYLKIIEPVKIEIERGFIPVEK
jgi:hypothetical protein